METTPAQTEVQLDRLYQWISDVKTQFTREIDQGLLKRDIYLAIEALGGREACDRIRRQIDFGLQRDRNMELLGSLPVKGGKKRERSVV